MDDKKNVKILGQGTYGKVIVYDFINNNGEVIKSAAKMMSQRGCFSGSTNYNEMGILQTLGKTSDFIVKLLNLEILSYSHVENENDEYEMNRNLFLERQEYLMPIFEIASCDALDFFKNSRYSYFEMKMMSSQILMGLEYMNRKGICHRDLKSTNILVFLNNGQITLKIADFGFAIYLPYKGERDYYVQTVTYRAPEIMFGVNNYEITCDIWSAGVIFMEMFIGKTWFSQITKHTTKEQYISECISSIADELTPEIQVYYRQFSGDLSTKINGNTQIRKLHKGRENYISFLTMNRKNRSIRNSEIEEFSNFLKEILKFDYFNRRTPRQLLTQSPFFNEISEYIDIKRKEQNTKNDFEVVNFEINEPDNILKTSYFINALEILEKNEKIYIRHFFYALDIANRFLTINNLFKVEDVCACSLYFVHKNFSFSRESKNPEVFFFHQFENTNITLKERLALDKKIYDFESELLGNNAPPGNIIRPCFYDMQNCYKNQITEAEKHDLSKIEIVNLFKELCKVNCIKGKSYRKIYREFYKKYIDQNFIV